MSASDASTRHSLSWCRARTSRRPRPRRKSSARSIFDSVSTVTGVPYGTRDDRQGCAGLSHTGMFIRWAMARTAALSSPASSRGLRALCSAAASIPGR